MNSLKPKKSLGQHFLHSPSALQKIIDAANIKPGETILEIGPGTGILTTKLLEAGAQVVAIEKDERVFGLLEVKFAKEIAEKKLRLIIGDVLEINIGDLIGEHYALVANIPYYITGAILQKFLENSLRPSRIVFLVQREVAERIVARDGKESILSISVKTFGVPKIVATVPRGAFVPPPNVDSAILEISDISGRRFAGDEKISKFFEVVRAGFAHKRKFAKKNLEALVGREILINIWQKLGLDQKVRAEDMTVEQWVKISDIISA
jgi:16S rRNA (adenine1518-N6/adenine1519-N6)-dimethyltransferase